VQREPLAEGRSQVERPHRHRPQAAPRQPSIAPSSGVRETPAGEETRQASRRDASSTSPTARFGSRAGEDAGKSRGKDAAARAEQGAEEAGAVPGKPVQFRSDWTGAVLTTQQQLRLETLKPLMKTSEERESRRRAGPPSPAGRLLPPPVAPNRHEVVYPEIAQPGAHKFQIRAEPGSDSADGRRSRAKFQAARSSTMPIG